MSNNHDIRCGLLMNIDKEKLIDTINKLKKHNKELHKWLVDNIKEYVSGKMPEHRIDTFKEFLVERFMITC